MDAYWQQDPLDYPRHALPKTADAVVVGGGLVGVCVALTLAEAGLKPVVLEGARLAAGASGRNGGLLLPGTAEGYPALAERWSRASAPALWGLGVRGARRLVGWIEGHGIDCTWRPEGGLHVATSPEEAARLSEAVVALVDDGFDVTWLTPEALRDWCTIEPARPLHGALLLPTGGALHCGRLVSGLGAAAARAGAAIVEDTPVTGVDATPQGVTVATARGTVSAEAAVVATNATAGRLLPALERALTPVRGQMLVGAPLTESVFRGAWSLNAGFEYLQQLPDRRIALGGMRPSAPDREVGYTEPTVNDAVQRRLEDWWRAMFPDLPLAVERRWAGIMAFTADRLPLVGPVEAQGRLWVAAGFNGHGVPFAPIAAELVTAELTGRSAPAHEPARRALAPDRPSVQGRRYEAPTTDAQANGGM